MRIDIITALPDLVVSPLEQSILQRAAEKELVHITVHDLREYATDKHRQIDDYPFGGGAGMVLKPEPIFACVEAIEQVRLSGGGARSPLWRQIIADVLDVELVTVNTTEGAAFGAALLAGVGAGIYEDAISAANAMIKVTGRTSPSAERAVYDDYYAIYQALYPALKDQFTAIAQREEQA